MRCINDNCHTPNLSPDLSHCPNCGVMFESLYRDLLPLGTTLEGSKYKVEDYLGRGGFGVTYQAHSSKFACSVAIKEYFPQNYADRRKTGALTHRSKDFKEPYDRWRKRFQQEAQILFRLDHPSIVRVIDYFDERNTTYMVMRLLEGQTLDAELKPYQERGEGLPESRVVQIMDDLASALDLLHSQVPPIYHLDIKPSNIMVLPTGKAVLIDFGAAKPERTRTTTVARSDDYAPIELWLGEYDSRSDIFELGMVLHELLTGKLPPRALSRDRGTAKGWEPSLAEPWKSLVTTALRLEPSERPRNVAAWWGRYARWHQAQAEEEQKRREAAERAKREAEDRQRAEAEEARRRKEEQHRLDAERRKREAAEKALERERKKRAGTGLPRRRVLEGLGMVGVGLVGAFVINGLLDNNGTDTDSSVADDGIEPSPQPTTPEFVPSESPTPPDSGNSLQTFNFETVTVNDRGEEINRQQGQVQSFSEDLGNGVSLEMVAIPGGTFVMGSPEDEAGRDDDESPQHQVTVQPFFMGRYQVTQAQWQAIMGNNPARFKGDNRPVESVSWDDAVEFCEKLSQITGREYRLPSEAQWEYACRAGTTTPFHFGETITSDLVNFRGTSTYANAPEGVYREETTPVGTFLPNAFGLYDMHGNVWDWCEDVWHDNYQGAPTDGSAWNVGGNQDRRVIRGGSWFYNPGNCRSADRNYGTPGLRLNNMGFRVLCAVAPGLL